MTIQTLGIDIAKTVFQLHGVNRAGRPVLKRRVMPDQQIAVVAQIEPCTIAIENWKDVGRSAISREILRSTALRK